MGYFFIKVIICGVCKPADLMGGNWGDSRYVLNDRINMKLKKIKVFNEWTFGIGEANRERCTVKNLGCLLKNASRDH